MPNEPTGHAPMALAKIEVTSEQHELIRRTIAKDSTNDEMALFVYDCTRRGVHPLDRLIHFTKRGGKYTPVTGIDYMRQRAAKTGECVGISDPVFSGEFLGNDFQATVTVYRLVKGVKAEFTATARWEEYYPENAFMWDKMPHTMLGKCAEALALRKGFPEETGGLYLREEMDQAGPEADLEPAVVVHKPKGTPTKSGPPKPTGTAPATNGGGETSVHVTGFIAAIVKRKTSKGTDLFAVSLADDTREYTSFDAKIAEEAKGLRDAGIEVAIDAVATPYKGKNGAAQFNIKTLAPDMGEDEPGSNDDGQEHE
jgi:phage recombination protein Bet